MAEPTPIARLEVGYIGRAHGVQGAVNVRLTTDRLERVVPGAVLAVGERELIVTDARPHQKGFIVTFEGVDSRDAAEELRGKTLLADPIDDPDTIWIHDLIGARLEEVDGTDRGVIEAVQENPASDLLVTSDGALVPLTFFVEQRGDLVVVDPPPGLFEDGDR